MIVVLADPSHVGVGPSFPEQEISGRITPIEAVKKISNIYVRPHEGPLNFWQPDFSEADILNKRNKRICCRRIKSHRRIPHYLDLQYYL